MDGWMSLCPHVYGRFSSNSVKNERLSRHNMLWKLREIRGLFQRQCSVSGHWDFCHCCCWSFNQERTDGVIHRAYTVITWRCYFWYAAHELSVNQWSSLPLDMEIQESELLNRTRSSCLSVNPYAPHGIFLHLLCSDWLICIDHRHSAQLLLTTVSNIISLVISIAWPVLSHRKRGEAMALFSVLDLFLRCSENWITAAALRADVWEKRTSKRVDRVQWILIQYELLTCRARLDCA